MCATIGESAIATGATEAGTTSTTTAAGATGAEDTTGSAGTTAAAVATVTGTAVTTVGCCEGRREAIARVARVVAVRRC